MAAPMDPAVPRAHAHLAAVLLTVLLTVLVQLERRPVPPSQRLALVRRRRQPKVRVQDALLLLLLRWVLFVLVREV